MARHGISRLSRMDRATADDIRYEREHPGELPHIDVKKLGRIPDGGGGRVHGREIGRPGHKPQNGFDYLHVAVDDHTRIAFVQAHIDEKGQGMPRAPATRSRSSLSSESARASDDR